MEDPRTYAQPFRIDANEIAAGDLTEGLSVPWQAGFNIGTGNWWPGARPVFVIVKRDGNYTTEFWTRPYTAVVPVVPVDVDSQNIYENYRNIYENQRMAHNLCMIDNWKDLGFLTRDLSVTEPLYIETERTLED